MVMVELGKHLTRRMAADRDSSKRHSISSILILGAIRVRT